MPQSLINEFLDRRKAGGPFRESLKEAIFQAKSSIGEEQADYENQKFQIWKIQMRGKVDNDPVSWWFASTAIPLLAASLGPLANVMSIGALITKWRVNRVDPANPTGDLLPQLQGAAIPDPLWCFWINAASLLLGFVGNFFLLLNFTNRIRYIISLPMTIFLWFIACNFLIGDLAAVHLHAPPIAPTQAYSEGFWYAVAAASLYLLLSLLLMGNLLGYIRGHYPQHFELTEDQRTLIVQTMMYFIWLAGGAGVFSRIEGWHFVDALYYCDVTILTIGFGDLYPQTNTGRAILIPYSIGGIIMLGLVISSIYKSVQDIGEQNIIRHHFEHQRERIVGRTVTTSLELERRQIELEIERERAHAKHAVRSSARSPATILHRSNTSESLIRMQSRRGSVSSRAASISGDSIAQSVKSFAKKKNRILLLREEKERFDEMRLIQQQSETWKNWWRLSISLSVFGVFWCIGAVVFWQAEKDTQNMTYWQSVYFCWVSLLSIGYGDYSPHSAGGRCFFIIWSLVAVPTMTILAGDLTSTVISVFNSWSVTLADFTILPQHGIWRDFMSKHSWIFMHLPRWLAEQVRSRAAQERVKEGFTVGSDSERQWTDSLNGNSESFTKDEKLAAGTARADIMALADQHVEDMASKHPDAAALARQLALAIRRAAHDMSSSEDRKYSYEEWVEFTRLIRFSAVGGPAEAFREEEEEGLIEWDWLAEDSPMMRQESEPEFVMDRLCESLVRYLRRNPPHSNFAGSVKDVGEDGLRLRGGGWHEEPTPAAAEVPAPAPGSKTRRSSKAGLVVTGEEEGPSSPLHPVEEEDHEHHIH